MLLWICRSQISCHLQIFRRRCNFERCKTRVIRSLNLWRNRREFKMFAPFRCFSENLRGFTEKMLKKGWQKQKSWLRENLKEENKYWWKKLILCLKQKCLYLKKKNNNHRTNFIVTIYRIILLFILYVFNLYICTIPPIVNNVN